MFCLTRIKYVFPLSCCFFIFCAVASANAAFVTFTFTGGPQNFVVPAGVTSVDVLAIGGGGGGANGHQGGGGSGYVGTGTFAVTPGQSITVNVGAGGTGAVQQLNNNIVGLTPGQPSSFGAFLASAGGGVVLGGNSPGGDGGSGGGGACNGGCGAAGTPGGAGGSGGSNGQTALYLGGIGQGNYTPSLSLFTDNILSAGAGGVGSTFPTSIWNGGGGGGGILLNGIGPNGGNGSQALSGQGGAGYGAGAGAGGFDGVNSSIRYAGGDGAPGLVYVEFADGAAIPEPSTFTLLALGLLSLSMIGWRRRRR